MHVSRSTFLRACGAAALSAALPAGRLLDNRLAAAASAVAAPSASDFRPHVGTRFRLGASQSLRLVEVVEPAAIGGVEQFSLIFAAEDGAIHDGIHTLRHASIGRLDVFVAAIGAPGRKRYEACFSRHTARAERA